MAILEDEDDTAELSLALVEFTAEAEALEPASLAEAKCHPDWALWEGGMREELTTLATAGTSELVDPPAGANIVRSKWVFRAKKDAAGNIVHHKARLVWLHSLIGDLVDPITEPTTLFSDNQSAIALMKDHQYHAHTKHTDIHFHFIRWVIEDGKLRLIFCPTGDMIADTLTKALPSPKVKHFASQLRLHTA